MILTGIMLNIYIVIGCDTVSFIFNKSKSCAFKILSQNFANLKEFGAYGEYSSVDTEKAIE